MNRDRQISRRHHFVPEFYLKAWNAADGKGLWLYERDFGGQVKSYRRSSRSVGCARDLYTLRPEINHPALDPPEDAIEQGFFSRIDADAAKVHRKLTSSGIKDLTTDDRRVWALFMNSLIERNPYRIAEVEATDTAENTRDAMIEKFGHSEILSKIDFDAMYRNSIRRALIDRIRDKAFVENLADMKWALIRIPIEGEHFLTSDMPVVINAGQGGMTIYCLSLPISPSLLLIINEGSLTLDEDIIRTLAVVHNFELMKNAKKYVVSSRKLDDGPHTKYSRVIQHFLPDPRE